MAQLSFEEYSRSFDGYEIPAIVKALFDFDKLEQEYYSSGFELYDYISKQGLKVFSKDEIFLSSFIEFAQANGSGSTYAFWLPDGNTDLEKAPIAIFGDEGGVFIVAENIRQLLQILTYDTEPSVSWEEVYYYKSEDESSARSQEFKEWVLKMYDIEPIDNADDLVQQAQEKYQEELKNWMQNFGIE